ncbi:FecR family protein [Dyadobacter sandarakinus]|uniref:FecR domain-containing protein n=1 Tax=Dyadobacter sandarakinus TaxID=2747268 RepID=A0ABX7IBL9_9BACT|nr:FecR domain-containing protein [Dyadobacter sandarakinus]QRR03521.1 FecR domain-containing protein [Dyadobacter sandarakinus]
MKGTLSKLTLFEYLSGRANPLERQRVEDWIGSEANSELFYQWLLEYESQYPQFSPDEDAAATALLNRINTGFQESPARHEDEQGFQYPNAPVQWSRYWLMAASIAVVFGFGWIFREPVFYKTYQTGYGQTTEVYLEDGSRVCLNANSKLKVPRLGFAADVRNVILEGEAEFAVSHTIDHKRFVVKTSEQFQVEVLGTTFSVFARPRGTRVALKSGSVRLDYSQNNKKSKVLMEPGDLASLDRSGAVQLMKKQDFRTFAPWTEQRYVFNGTPVQEIAAMIEENFGQKVALADPVIGRRTITGNFKTKSAQELLKTVSEVLDLHIQQQGDTTLLTNN